MASCEHRRTSAYEEDLRLRMVWQREGEGFTLEKIANNLNVDKSTVLRVTSSIRASGIISKGTYPKGDDIKPNKLLTECVQLHILHYILQHPSSYLWEIQSELQASLQINLSITSICRFLRKNNFTRQKLSILGWDIGVSPSTSRHRPPSKLARKKLDFASKCNQRQFRIGNMEIFLFHV